MRLILFFTVTKGFASSIPNKEWGINKVYKTYEDILLLSEAKNAGDAAHRRGFLTKLDGKRTSKDA
ncbi:MAG TPA: hypothetical protein VJ953_14860 [Saprospiraceae bacterium]|nr:hypothetical protein [Saprospiraceae bacterium]